MPKSKRLMELMMTVNRKRRFKVRELADEFGVSKRTILRDLQELSELGVPLYSEVGPNGGYQVVRERVLPPIAFTEEEAGGRRIQPVCLYANNGFWYCTAYCFLRKDFRVFRCDRIRKAEPDPAGTEPLDLGDIRLSRREAVEPREPVRLRAELSRAGAQRCESELWLAPMLHVREDGSGVIDRDVSRGDMPFYADFFIGLGEEAELEAPAELRETIRRKLGVLLSQYS